MAQLPHFYLKIWGRKELFLYSKRYEEKCKIHMDFLNTIGDSKDLGGLEEATLATPTNTPSLIPFFSSHRTCVCPVCKDPC